MRTAIVLRPLTENERQQIQAGWRANDAFVLRRGPILRASARGERALAMARQLSCDDQTVRNVIHGFNSCGLPVLHERSSRPHRLHTSLSEEGRPRLKDLLQCRPREFGHERSTWTLQLAAQVSCEQGISSAPISDESVRRALKRLTTTWKRAKPWMTSPDPLSRRKQTPATAGWPAAVHNRTGRWDFWTRCGGAAWPCRECRPGKLRSRRCVWGNSPGTKAIVIPTPWLVRESSGSRDRPASPCVAPCRCAWSLGVG